MTGVAVITGFKAIVGVRLNAAHSSTVFGIILSAIKRIPKKAKNLHLGTDKSEK